MKAAARLELREDEAIEVEALLARKAGDLRRGAVALLLNRPDAAVLASVERLLARTAARPCELRAGRGRRSPARCAEAGRGARRPAERRRRRGAAHARGRRSACSTRPRSRRPPSRATGRRARHARPRSPRCAALDALVHEHRDAEFEIEGFSGRR